MKSTVRLAILAVLALAAASAAADGPSDPARRAQLLDMLRQDCGSCHGMTMKGGLGPPLLPAALAQQRVADLAYVIMNGRHGTPMPPWRPFMTEDEALWMAGLLKTGLPDEAN